MASFFLTHWDVILFYSVVVVLLYVFRGRFEWQGIVALYRTKLGLRFMKETGEKYAGFWNGLGIVSIILGFLGMAFMLFMLLYGAYQLFFVPDAPPVLSPLIPGVSIPGVPITLPLWYSLFAIFLGVIVHEGAHGVFASAYKIKIKSSGFAIIGPLPGAFVEPDEKTLDKRPLRQKLTILSGGPFSNVVLAVVALGLMVACGAGLSAMNTNDGVAYLVVQNNTAASAAGMPAGGVITAIDGQPILERTALTAALERHAVGDTIVVRANSTDYPVTLGANPSDATKAYLGVYGAQTSGHLTNSSLGWLAEILYLLSELLYWTLIVSAGLGLANLIPAGPLDGGRMFYLLLEKRYKPEVAKRIFTRWSLFLLVLIIPLVFFPILRAIF